MEINGLPLHALVVHAAVVLTPLAAVTALGYAVVGRWRDVLRWPLAVLVAVAVAAVWVAYLSGQDVKAANQYGGELVALLETHESRANVLRWSATGFGAAALAAVGLHRQQGALRLLLSAAVVATAALTLVYAVLTGDAGAQLAWFGVDG